MPRSYTYKRFVRNSKPQPFRLQPQDVEILGLLFSYRFLTTYQILALQPRGLRNLRRRLQYMFHAGLVDRPPKQHDFLRPPGPMVYGLSNRGADVLSKVLKIERSRADWHGKNRSAGLHYIDHTLMISNFRVCLTLACRASGRVSLITWQQGPELKITAPVAGRRYTIEPDGFFTLEYQGATKDAGFRRNYYVEADRSTMSQKRFLRKMQVYQQWRKDAGHRRQLRIAAFRVLIITISEQRCENLRVLARKVYANQKGSAMFLFACERHFNLNEPGTILGPIWRAPIDDTYHRVIDDRDDAKATKISGQKVFDSLKR